MFQPWLSFMTNIHHNHHITTSADMWNLGAVIAFITNDREDLVNSKEDVFNWKNVESPINREFKYKEIHQLVLALLSIDKFKRSKLRIFFR